MPRDPLTIVREYLDHDQPQVRKNAFTALAVLGTEDSVTELAERTLGIQDDGLRATAESEIEKLAPEMRQLAIGKLTAALTGSAPTNAYATLGRLRSQGVKVDLGAVPPLTRMKLAIQRGIDYRDGSGHRFWRLRFGVAAGVAVAATAATVLWASAGFGIDAEDTLWGSLGMILLMTLLSAASGLSAPIASQASRGCGVAWDCVVTAAVVTIPALAAGLSAESEFLAVFSAIVVASIAARLGSAAALGVTMSPVYNFSIQTLTGFGVGILVLAAVLVAAVGTNYDHGGGVWYYTSPALAVIAAAYALLDSRHAATKAAPAMARWFALGCAAAALGAGLYAALLRVETPTPLDFKPGSEHVLRFDRSPHKAALVIGQARTRLAVSSGGCEGLDWMVDNVTGFRPLKREYAPLDLRAGITYSLHVSPEGRYATREWHVLGDLLRRLDPAATRRPCTITLKALPAN